MKINDSYTKVFASFVLFVVTVTPVTAFADPGKLSRIGILTDLTGKAAYIGQHTRSGAELAAEEINVSGKRLEIVFGDHGLDTVRAVSEAQKLVNIDHVDAVISNFSGPTRAASSVVKNGGKLLVYIAAGVSVVKENTYAFKSYLDYIQGCESIAKYWKDQGITKVGQLKPESEFGELCEIGAKKVFPELVVASYKVGEEVATQALVLKSKGVQAVLNATLEGDFKNMLKAFSRLAYRPKLGGNEDMFTESVVSENSTAIAGARSFGMPKPPQGFCDRLHSKNPALDMRNCDQAAMSYLHVKQIFAALEACPRGGVECQVAELIKAPAAPDFGFIKWREDRQALYKDSLVTR